MLTRQQRRQQTKKKARQQRNTKSKPAQHRVQRTREQTPSRDTHEATILNAKPPNFIHNKEGYFEDIEGNLVQLGIIGDDDIVQTKCRTCHEKYNVIGRDFKAKAIRQYEAEARNV